MPRSKIRHTVNIMTDKGMAQKKNMSVLRPGPVADQAHISNASIDFIVIVKKRQAANLSISYMTERLTCCRFRLDSGIEKHLLKNMYGTKDGRKRRIMKIHKPQYSVISATMSTAMIVLTIADAETHSPKDVLPQTLHLHDVRAHNLRHTPPSSMP